jgi:glycerol-3-phosphate dehydrogenase
MIEFPIDENDSTRILKSKIKKVAVIGAGVSGLGINQK